MEVRLEQPSNALDLMVVTLLGMMKFSRLAQLAKAHSSIDVTLLGITKV